MTFVKKMCQKNSRTAKNEKKKTVCNASPTRRLQDQRGFTRSTHTNDFISTIPNN